MSSILIFFAFFVSCLAKTVTYNFDITWVNAAPDGFSRPVIAMNKQWPLPIIEADLGDTVIVKARNLLGNETTSIHFHGMLQVGTSPSDGPVGVSQCSIPPGGEYTYQFTAYPAGTFWYHSHDKGQYPDGFRGQMIVHDPAWEKSLGVDEQVHFSVSDWYHEQMPVLLHKYLSPDNPTGVLPIPDSMLVNDSSTPPDITFEPGKKYLLRIVNMGALSCSSIQFQNHDITVVGIDGVHVVPKTTSAITICAGQRYDIVIQGLANPKNSVGYLVKMATDMFDSVPSGFKTDYTGKCLYKSGGVILPMLGSVISNPSLSPSTTLDDFTLQPLDGQKLLGAPDQKIKWYINQKNYPGIGSRISLAQQPWVEPEVPSLYTALTTGPDANNPATYGIGAAASVLAANSIIEIVLTNPESHPHPMHMHGHEYQVVARGTGVWDGNTKNFPTIPMKRDVAVVPAKGYFVLRFRADNPGVWFFHCHIDWHLAAGMAATLVEAPTQLQKSQAIPAAGQWLCWSNGKEAKGNCAGAVKGNLASVEATANCPTIFNTNTDGYGSLVVKQGKERRDGRWSA
ncbi:hypothetical protein BU16DRAFT_470681 [Lophium mytilinum]|uniref:Multicopper oxidase n=1 Tax=Lophium mytilinum TaxID=390894 RepID=A0A6A6QDS1_9PEZI|nr:hypothetical protein BU16DRAFT_470681 [Lophium mytilinum]